MGRPKQKITGYIGVSLGAPGVLNATRRVLQAKTMWSHVVWHRLSELLCPWQVWIKAIAVSPVGFHWVQYNVFFF